MTKFFNDQGGLDKIAARLAYAKSQMPANIREAHEHCSKHRTEIVTSHTWGCFYCLEIFDAREIEDWTDDGQTAMCAKCGIDSVIGSGSGFPITKEFLREMNRYWF